MDSNAEWYSFAFSSDGKKVIYITAEEADRGGDLYVANYDGGDSLKLDTGVWSFQDVSDGRFIVYYKIDDLDRGEPSSEMYRIRRDGEKKERLLPPDDGIFTLLSMP
jgi:hypothetical protein